VMKMLFLLGVCHELTGEAGLLDLFSAGMQAVVPLLSSEGQFSYFGRTDNSPFAAALTIFDLRKAAAPGRVGEASEAAALRAERFYLASPRTAAGLLRCNRYAGGDTPDEVWRSQDDYAYSGQYSLASCAYAMLACRWFPRPAGRASSDGATELPAVSRDLGLVKLGTSRSEVLIRTAGEITAWDRRYQGPTILRYGRGDRLLIGAIAKTLSTDWRARPREGGRYSRLLRRLQHRYLRGFDELDAVSVGFLPVLRRGPWDYVPATSVIAEISATHVATRHEFVRFRARGIHPCVLEATQALRNKVRVLPPAEYIPLDVEKVDGITLDRVVRVGPDSSSIQDRVSGALAGKQLLFSVRSFPDTSVVVRGLEADGGSTGWGSDGVAPQSVFSAWPDGRELRYECELSPT